MVATALTFGVAGTVLAGGRSTRFGDADENKAVATVGTETLLSRVVGAVTSAMWRPPIITVQSAEQREMYAELLSDHGVSFVFDDKAFEGPLAGIFGTVAATDESWLFCCGCDMPFLSPVTINWLLDELQNTLRTSDTLPAAVTVQHPDGTVEPLHTLYRTAAINDIRDQLPPTAGPRRLLATLSDVVTIPVEAIPEAIPIEESTTNVNTRVELETATNQIEPE